MFFLPYGFSALFNLSVYLIRQKSGGKKYFSWYYFSVSVSLLLYFSQVLSSFYFATLIATVFVMLSEGRGLLTSLGNFSAWVSVIILSGALGYFGIALCCIPFLINAVLLKIGKEKRKEAEKLNEKTGTRDFMQVFSNLFPTLVFALVFAFTKNTASLIGAGASMASAFADSSASDIGVLSKKSPFDIFTHKPVKRGISGGVSLLGTVSAGLSSIFIAGVFLAFYNKMVWGFLIIVLSGFLGTVIDSAFGSKLQVKYKCVCCGEITEKHVHCNRLCKKISGVSFINNDAVNLISSALAGMVAFICALFL